MKLPKTLQAVPVRLAGQYVIITPNYWGRGASLEEAVRQIRRAGGSVFARCVVAWQSNADRGGQGMPYVDELGRLMSYGSAMETLLNTASPSGNQN